MIYKDKYFDYIFTIQHHDDGTFDVDFPDIPEIITGGESMEEAYPNACESLDLHFTTLEEWTSQTEANL